MKQAEKLDALQGKMRLDAARRKERPIAFRDVLKAMQADGRHDGICRCLRELNWFRPHCPACGSTNVIGTDRRSGVRTLPNGNDVYAIGFRCQRCTFRFQDVDTFLHCEAMPPQPAMKEVRLQEAAKQTLQAHGFADASDFQRKLEEFRQKRHRAAQGAEKEGNTK